MRPPSAGSERAPLADVGLHRFRNRVCSCDPPLTAFRCALVVMVLMQAFSYVRDVETFSMMDKASNQVSQAVNQPIEVSFGRDAAKFYEYL